MKRRKLLAALLSSSFLLTFCNQKEKPRYQPKECPFCKGATKCRYCKGDGKCSYCKGTGTRDTKTLAPKGSTTKKVTISGQCPFCKGSGKCHYCDGKGQCHVCKGEGQIDKWEW